ncbi:hypothetical protein [Lacrimispora indolis]|uniref:hypothetical protein n=1 Tax=Lacrimispora indolis TaxID=69825 RepID=UPI00041E2323|nr:hypothetical protein [[Clostridium] methoxybenzovorans]
MNGDFIVVSKEEAIRKIMEAPGDTVVIGKISITNQPVHFIHDKPVRSKKMDGKLLIIAANEIEYQNNNYFGTLSLHGIEKEEEEEESVIHNILFPQLE